MYVYACVHADVRVRARACVRRACVSACVHVYVVQEQIQGSMLSQCNNILDSLPDNITTTVNLINLM